MDSEKNRVQALVDIADEVVQMVIDAYEDGMTLNARALAVIKIVNVLAQCENNGWREAAVAMAQVIAEARHD